MTNSEAKKIGGRYALISVAAGLVIAQLIMTLFAAQDGILNGFFWFVDFNYLPNVLVGIMSLILFGSFYGRIAGKLILINKWNYVLTGFLTGLLAIISASFIASWIGFFQEGIDDLGTYQDPLSDYIITPIVTVSIFGLIPALIIGIWFGRKIKKKEEHDTQHGV